MGVKFSNTIWKVIFQKFFCDAHSSCDVSQYFFKILLYQLHTYILQIWNNNFTLNKQNISKYPTLSDSILEFFNFSVADLTKFPYGETWPSFSFGIFYFFKKKILEKKLISWKKEVFFLSHWPKIWLTFVLYMYNGVWTLNLYALFEFSRVFFWVKLSGKIQTHDLILEKNMYIFTLKNK